MSLLERDFQKDAIAYIERRGGYVLKTHVSSYQSQGEPDLTVCYLGRYVAFELKVPGNRPTKLQEYKLSLIAKAGGIAKAVYALEEIKEVLDDISRIQSSGEPR